MQALCSTENSRGPYINNLRGIDVRPLVSCGVGHLGPASCGLCGVGPPWIGCILLHLIDAQAHWDLGRALCHVIRAVPEQVFFHPHECRNLAQHCIVMRVQHYHHFSLISSTVVCWSVYKQFCEKKRLNAVLRKLSALPACLWIKGVSSSQLELIKRT